MHKLSENTPSGAKRAVPLEKQLIGVEEYLIGYHARRLK
jgi:hypothetical protein